MKKIEYTVGSNNVFSDLGFADPKTALVKAQLALQIARILKATKTTQVDAASRMDISQAKVSSLLRGDLHGISEAKLQSCLNLLGHDVLIVLKPHVGKGSATTSVLLEPTPRPKKLKPRVRKRPGEMSATDAVLRRP